jgi:hypothetical protein
MNYLETLPLSSIAKYAKGQPGSGVPFTGYPRVHPAEKNKLLLVYDPLGSQPVVLEFKHEDILFVEEVPSAVTEDGEGVPLVKLWIQRGATGMIMEPFEVGEPVNDKARAAKERIFHTQDNMQNGAPYATPRAAQ